MNAPLPYGIGGGLHGCSRRAAMAVGVRGLATLLAGGTAPSAVDAQAPAARPIRLRDALERDVVLPQPPQRIVTIFSSNTELVVALGLAGRIVGVEEFTRYPADVARLPKVGGRLGFSVDAVAALRPDLVVVTPARQAAHQLIEPMARIDVPVVVLLSRSLQEVLDNVRLVARACGVPERGQAVAAALQARLDAVDSRLRAVHRPRALMVTGRAGHGMVLVARPGTYTGDAMERAGTRHAIPGLGTLSQVSPEALLSADPDVLLFAGTQAALDDWSRQPGWRDMRAVRKGKAIVVSRSEFLIPGPRTLAGIESLAAHLHAGPQKAAS